MTDKPKRYQKYEKKEIEALIKCRRERERHHISGRLMAQRDEIEKPFKAKIEEIMKDMAEAVAEAGLTLINVRGCTNGHPDLDKLCRDV